jgi:hypothetical protein
MTRQRFDTVDLLICTDCAMMAASGSLEGGSNISDDAQDSSMARRLGADVMHLIVGDDYGFSSRDCDACDIDDGAGDRFTAVLLIPVDAS